MVLSRNRQPYQNVDSELLVLSGVGVVVLGNIMGVSQGEGGLVLRRLLVWSPLFTIPLQVHVLKCLLVFRINTQLALLLILRRSTRSLRKARRIAPPPLPEKPSWHLVV